MKSVSRQFGLFLIMLIAVMASGSLVHALLGSELWGYAVLLLLIIVRAVVRRQRVAA